MQVIPGPGAVFVHQDLRREGSTRRLLLANGNTRFNRDWDALTDVDEDFETEPFEESRSRRLRRSWARSIQARREDRQARRSQSLVPSVPSRSRHDDDLDFEFRRILPDQRILPRQPEPAHKRWSHRSIKSDIEKTAAGGWVLDAVDKALEAIVDVDRRPQNHNEKIARPGADANALAGLAGDGRYLYGGKLISVMLGLSFAVFCVALDNTIIATAIPDITDAFQSTDQVGWYSSAYLLCACSFVLLYGKFYATYNIKYVFLCGLLIFEVGSIVCATASSSIALIIGRAIAGLGASGLFSGALIITTHIVELRQRPIYIGALGAMYGVASVAGPLLGGAFTDNVHLTWRWCFYINLPFGAVTAVVLLTLYHPPQHKNYRPMSAIQRFLSFDPFGTLCFVPSIMALLLALQWGGTEYPWSDARVVWCLVVFAVLMITFWAIQLIRPEKTVTIPPRIAAQRSIAGGCIFALCLCATFFIFIYYLPLYFQVVKDQDAVHSGISNIALIVAQSVGAVVAGGMTTWLGQYVPWMYVSTCFMAVGAGLLTTLQVDTPTGQWIGYQIIFGFGTGLGFQLPTLCAGVVLPIEDVPFGASWVLLVQILGGAIFTQVTANKFQSELLSQFGNQAFPGLDANTLESIGATQIVSLVPPSLVPFVVQTFNSALMKAFIVPVILACISVVGIPFVEWKSVKGKGFAIPF